MLRSIVRAAHGPSSPRCRARWSEGARAPPDLAAFHELQGLQLELDGAAPEKIRAAYARALELDPRTQALGRARPPAARIRPAARQSSSCGAAAADRRIRRRGSRARALRAAQGPTRRATARCSARPHPFAWEAPAELVSLDSSAERSPKTLERANRAARFGGGLPRWSAWARCTRSSAMRRRPRRSRAGEGPEGAPGGRIGSGKSRRYRAGPEKQASRVRRGVPRGPYLSSRSLRTFLFR